MSKVDLHLHSNASDGRFSPEDIIRKAVEHGLSVIAITDHDTVEGIVPALASAKDFPGLMIVPGVEISTDVPSGEVHVLGYFIDYADPELKATLQRLRNSREGRAQGMIAKLGALGIHIEWRRVQDIAAGGAIGRPHIAQAMLEKGYIFSLKEAFTKYIGRDGPAYVEREKMLPAEAVGLVLRAKGLPVLAHPFTITEPEAMVVGLKAAGLVGIEAYYGEYTVDEVSQLVNMADKYGLVPTGGSDYHGLDTTEPMMGSADVPMEAVTSLVALAEEGALKLSNWQG